MSPETGDRATGFRFPGWRLPTDAAVARGGDESRSAVGPLTPTGDSGDERETGLR